MIVVILNFLATVCHYHIVIVLFHAHIYEQESLANANVKRATAVHV